MGFLNGLVNDMLKESTGYDVRKITRMVGGKNLLMLGAGAALAGGMASGFGKGAQDGPSTWADPPRGGGGAPPRGPQPGGAPPLPPTPGESPGAPRNAPPPPPLPPTPSAAPPSATPDRPPLPPTPEAPPTPAPADETETEEIPISPELTFAIVRAMVAAALADGNLDEKEKTVILDRLGTSGLDAGRVQQVHRDLVIPPTPAELAEMTDVFSEREAMYRFAGLILLSDGNVAELERGWLDRLAVAFGFDAERKAALEAEIFE